MATAIVNKIIPFSSVDGPGNRTAIFLQGCNFNCKYCHNPETIKECVNCGACVSKCRTGALYLDGGRVAYDATKCVQCDECIHNCPNSSSPKTFVKSVEDILLIVQKNMPFIRGITVSGGECTRQRDFLNELFAEAKKLGLTTLIDSNGTYPFDADEVLMSVTDGVMLDVKSWNNVAHKDITGCSNEDVLKNLDYLLKSDKLAEVRTVVIPELMDGEETIRQVSSKLKEYGRTKVRVKIIKYRSYGVRAEYKGLKPPEDEFLLKLKATAESYGLTDVVII